MSAPLRNECTFKTYVVKVCNINVQFTMVKEQIRTTHMKLFINKRRYLGVSATEYYLLLHSIARGTLSLSPIDTYL